MVLTKNLSFPPPQSTDSSVFQDALNPRLETVESDTIQTVITLPLLLTGGGNVVPHSLKFKLN